MTTPPKTMEEIKNAEAEKYSGVEATDSDVALWSELSKAFKAGFDCRDKLDNEALKIAVEALEFYGATANWTSLSTRIEYDVFIEENDLKHIVIGEDEQGVIVVKMAGSKARETLAEIRKLRPES